MWDVIKAVAYLDEHAQPHSLNQCAKFVRKAVEAGGVELTSTVSAKDYGPCLERALFRALSALPGGFEAGDVAVIQPIEGHPHGHMAMYNGALWVSDFTQMHGYYPGPAYRSLKPAVVLYRYAMLLATAPALNSTRPRVASHAA